MADYLREAVAVLKSIAKELEGIHSELKQIRRDLDTKREWPAGKYEVLTGDGRVIGVIQAPDLEDDSEQS